jgi:hypothetical protein
VSGEKKNKKKEAAHARRSMSFNELCDLLYLVQATAEVQLGL